MSMPQPSWWDYAEFYPEEDEDGFDGVHFGGVKGVSKSAPERVKREFDSYKRKIEHGRRL